MTPFRPACAVLAVLLLAGAPAWAQGAAALVVPGSPADDDARTRALLQPGAPPWSLLRSTGTLSPAPADSGVRLQVLAPTVRAAWNGRLPLSMNEGALWAGRGAGVAVMAGVRAQAGPVTLVLAPELVYAANEPFTHLSIADTLRSALLPPWRAGRFSADLPLRPGTERVVRMDPGQSSLSVRAGAVEGGASTEAQWWGPGIRNAIVMSTHAGGIPHAFVRTARPLRTALGDVEARWMAGALTESRSFDFDPGNDHRTLSAAAVALRVAGARGLTVGAARAVVARGGDGVGSTLRAAPHVFTRWPGADTAGTASALQVFSLFGRWVLAPDGLEAYAEWARHELPGSPRDLLAAPHHTQGYTVGLQWARPVGGGGVLRLQAEATNLEQSSTFRTRPRPSFYASPSVPQGYTHRGRVIGAAIGPGASSQFAAADWMRGGGAVGVYGQRVRWDNDAYYTVHGLGAYHAHDVSVILGVRGRLATAAGTVSADVGREWRLNYLFQNPELGFGGEEAVDVRQFVLRLSLTPTP